MVLPRFIPATLTLLVLVATAYVVPENVRPPASAQGEATYAKPAGCVHTDRELMLHAVSETC